jgi:Domain of Unknown Function (DUF1080)
MSRARWHSLLGGWLLIAIASACGRNNSASGPGAGAPGTDGGAPGGQSETGGTPGGALGGESGEQGHAGAVLGSAGAGPGAAGAASGVSGMTSGGAGGTPVSGAAGSLGGSFVEGRGGTSGATTTGGSAGAAGGHPWIQLFNGTDLADWIPKFAGSAVGVNYKNTFRVVNGVLVVSYDQYQTWNGEFGHLFYKTKFSHYLLRAEYRFVGTQVSGGVSWGYLNNGLMLHCQDPAGMDLMQQFPVSLEFKLFGDDGKPVAAGAEPRTSGKICSPGTDVRINGALTLNQHCVETSTFHHAPNVWVTAEAEVHGSTHIQHRENGIVTADYTEPQLDPNDPNPERVYAKRLLDGGAPKLLSEGFIAIQSETHPTEFRKIELQELDE